MKRLSKSFLSTALALTMISSVNVLPANADSINEKQTKVVYAESHEETWFSWAGGKIGTSTVDEPSFEIRPDRSSAPEMPEVIKNRKPKHHVFKRDDNHSLILTGEVIMPGDTFEIQTDITYDQIYTIDFQGRADGYVTGMAEEIDSTNNYIGGIYVRRKIENNWSDDYYAGYFSPERYGIEVTGTVDITGYSEANSGSVDSEGNPIIDKFPGTFKNNLNCPILIGATGGGSDGPYAHYDDHDVRIARGGIAYSVLAPYYYITYSFDPMPMERDPEGFKSYYWDGGIENLDFPEAYWITDEEYSITVPNPVIEGEMITGWDSELNYDSINSEYENVTPGYTEISVKWDYKDSSSPICGPGELRLEPIKEKSPTLVLDPNGGTINGQDHVVLSFNAKYDRENSKFDLNLGHDIKDLVPEREGDTFLGWCAKKSARSTSFVTKDSNEEAFDYFWGDVDIYTTINVQPYYYGRLLEWGDSYDENFQLLDHYWNETLYAKWASESDDELDKNLWKLYDDGTLVIVNNEGAEAWVKAKESDPTLAPKVKKIDLGTKDDEYVEEVPVRAFAGCTSLESFESNVPVMIYDEAFSGCTSLKTVTFNEFSSQSIRVFEGCTSLESVTYKKEASMGRYIFENCPNLKTVTFESETEFLGESWFIKAPIDLVIKVPKEAEEELSEQYGSYSYLLEESVKRYPLTVNGEIITDDNLTVKCGDGTATFDPKTSTLTLKNADLTQSLIPHVIDSYTYENGKEIALPKAAIVSAMPELTIVLEGDVSVTTDSLGVPHFVRAEGDLVIKGDGTLKGTVSDMMYVDTDSEEWQLVEYTETGKVAVDVSGNLTVSNTTVRRLYADVAGTVLITDTTLEGGSVKAGKDLKLKNVNACIIEDEDTDRSIGSEMPEFLCTGNNVNIENSKLDMVDMKLGENTKNVTFKDSEITLASQLDADWDAHLNITNTSLMIYSTDQMPVTINPDNITLNGAKVVSGDWWNNGPMRVEATGEVTPDDPKLIIGDLDGDGEITANDALTILRSSVGMADLTPEQNKLADIDGDTEITANDALAVLRYSVGMSDADSPINKPVAA